MTDGRADVEATVLVVDDSEGTRFVFSNWLRRAGYMVHEAATGSEALEILAQTRFDIVLLDVNLPDMSGSDVVAEIKGTRRTASIPVLHVSATAVALADRTAGLNAGADGYLVEPVERDELLATVASLLRYHDARKASERSAARLEQLHQTTLLVNAAPTVTELIGFASTGAAAIFGAPALVLAVRDGRGWVAEALPDSVEPTLRTCEPGRVVAAAGAAQAGEPIDLSHLGISFDAELPAGPHSSAIATPRGELVGAVVLLNAAHGPDEALMLDHFCQAVAVAFENQRLYAVEHQIALTLQHAMLPQSLPSPAHLDLAARYQASSETVEIGGDFYEVIELDERTTLLAIGDVVGHSLMAATVMAELRHSLRAFAVLGLRSPQIIDRLSTVLSESHPDLSATMCLAEIDVVAEEVRVTNAGHIPPFVRSGDGGQFVEQCGPMLGMGVNMAIPTVSVPFRPGALIVLVTDGLLERRGESIDLGLARLRDAVLAHDRGVEALCDRLLHEVGAGEATFDDIAMVAARYRDGKRPERPEPPEGPESPERTA
jgi:CheY-like chemotaxis protein